MKATLVRQGLYVAGLTVVWLMLWDRVSIANTVAGILVACLVLLVFPTKRRSRERKERPTVIRPFAVLRLLGYVVWQIAVSNLLVAKEIVARRSQIRTGIIACRLHTTSPGLITLIADIIEISPGTMTVDTRAEPPTLYLHVLMLHDPLHARHQVAHLEQLVLRAFGTDEDVPEHGVPR